MTDSRPLFDAAVDETKAAAQIGYTQLGSIEIENPNTVVCYLQLFDALAADVTVGTTTPTLTLAIPKGDGTDGGLVTREYAMPPRFEKGLVYAITTTRTGNDAPTTDLPCNFTLA